MEKKTLTPINKAKKMPDIKDLKIKESDVRRKMPTVKGGRTKVNKSHP